MYVYIYIYKELHMMDIVDNLMVTQRSAIEKRSSGRAAAHLAGRDDAGEVVLRYRFGGVNDTRLYHGYITVISRLYHGYITVISRLYHGYITVISRLYQGCIMVVSW